MADFPTRVKNPAARGARRRPRAARLLGMAEPTRGRPRAEPREEQHERIIRAARVAFTEQGYDRVTMSGIARDAAVTRPVLYEVVGSKEQLAAAVANQVADELIEAVDARFSQPGELDRPIADLV